MNKERFASVSLQVLTWLWTLFFIFYGLIFATINLSSTIGFETHAEAYAARRTQLLLSVPHIVLGFTMLCALIVFYISNKTKIRITQSIYYDVIVVCLGALYTVGTIVIAIYLSYPYLIGCTATSIILSIYGICLIDKNKRVSKKSNTTT